MQYGVNNLWPTPVYLGKMADLELNSEMATELLISKDKLGATDEFNIFDSDREVIQRFKDNIVLPAFDTYFSEVLDLNFRNYTDLKMRAWLTSWQPGYNMKLHNHHGSEFSAVFYVLNEDTTSGGEITFVDPRGNANRGYDLILKNKLFADLEYMPRTGDFVVFPSFLYHYVNPFFSSLRMAIPVDLFLGPYTV